MDEEWREIPEFPSYSASSHGRVMMTVVDKNNHRLIGPLKQSKSPSGYLFVTMRKEGRGYCRRVNRLVCSAFHGPPPSPKHHAAHGNGNRTDNSKENLRWALPVENEADKRLHGTAAIGERHWSKLKPECRARGTGHGLAKLNPDAVRAIRSSGKSQRALATEYGVTQGAIQMVLCRKTWTHIDD